MGPPLWSVEIFSDENIILPPGADILKPSRLNLDGDTSINSPILVQEQVNIPP